MLTGDKVETAQCIAISAGFKSRRQNMFVMKNMTTESEIKHALVEFEIKASNTLLVIDGETMSLIFGEKSLQDRFFALAT